tara:strand:+ start:3720 stop:4442 length:723 start_codon:yes stop_codon:yes gene_type:complete
MELNFKHFLESANVVTRLAIFDFDLTIAKAPEKPQKGDNRHGWNGKDWWGSKESLTPPFYDMEVNEEIVEEMRKAKADPNTHVILLTGRRGIVSPTVRNVLRHHGLYGRRMIPKSNDKARSHYRGHEHDHDNHGDAHEEYYSGDFRTEPDYPKFGKKNKPAGDTLSHKVYIIRRMVDRLPTVTTVEMWDDRKDHFPHWMKLGKDLLRTKPIEKFFIHQVYNTASGTHYVQTVPAHNVKIY